MAFKTFRADDNEIAVDNSGRTNKTILNLFKNNEFRNLIYIPNIKDIEESIF